MVIACGDSLCYEPTNHNQYLNKLYTDIFIDYNKDIRPTSGKVSFFFFIFYQTANCIWYCGPAETNDPVQVYMELYLYKILDLDERNQVLHSNLWLRHSWCDFRLMWRPIKYDR